MRSIFLIAAFAMLATLVPVPQDKPDEESINIELRLKNGSFIKGTIKALETVKLKTKYATLKVPLKDLRSIAWGNVKKEERDTIVAADGTYKGWIEDFPTIEADTGYGVLKVPASALRFLRVWKKGANNGDDFESGSLDRWENFGGSWNAKDGKLQVSGRSVYSDVILYNEELDGTFTVEVEVNGNNTFGVLWHMQNGLDGVGLWIYPGSSAVGVYTGSGTYYSAQLAYWSVNIPAAQTHKVKLEVDGSRATVSVNDQQLGTVTTSHGKGKVGFFCNSGSATFDNFQIIR